MTQVAVGSQIWNFSEIGKEKKSPLLILHGWGRNGNEWMQIARELSNWSKQKIYVLDLPGFGGSSLPRVKDIFEYSELVREFCGYLDIKNAILIGHSLGGRVGIVLASKYPEMIEKLILVDPAGVKPKSIKRVILKVIAKIFAWIPKELRRKMAYLFMDEDYNNSPALRDLYRAIVRDDLREYLPKIKCKTMVVWGEKDPILPLSMTKVYRDKLHDCIVRVVWGAGHDSHLTHPRELIRILEES